jgi:3-keto-5-aminohexanoate cleavage enzyme
LEETPGEPVSINVNKENSMSTSDASKDKVKWQQVRKWVEREGLQTKWKAYGMPEILDPFTSAFTDVDPMPKWNVPEKVMISTTITGAFFSKRANPNHPISVDEIRDSAEQCILAGAPNIHIHVRDEDGYNVLDPQKFHDVVMPLRAKYPDVTFDGCLVAVNDEESAMMAKTMEMGFFDALPVNTTATCCGDNMFFKSPHVVIEKARLAQEAGCKPIISVYTDADVDNARRYLVDSKLVKGPCYWLILPALPGCSPMHNPQQMVDGLMRIVRSIRDIDPDGFIMVTASGRASTYLATLSLLLGLHVRVGMEDTLWHYPHRDELLKQNVDHFKQVRDIAKLLGRELMTPAEYRAALNMPARAAAKQA